MNLLGIVDPFFVFRILLLAFFSFLGHLGSHAGLQAKASTQDLTRRSRGARRSCARGARDLKGRWTTDGFEDQFDMFWNFWGQFLFLVWLPQKKNPSIWFDHIWWTLVLDTGMVGGSSFPVGCDGNGNVWNTWEGHGWFHLKLLGWPSTCTEESYLMEEPRSGHVLMFSFQLSIPRAHG